MFTIIGGDGKEYGPATADQIRAWISAGRANLETKAKALGSEEWRRLGDFAEFAGTSAPPPIPVAPAAGYSAPTGGYPAPLPVAPALPLEDPNLADRGARLLAALIDQVFVFVVCLPGIVMLGSVIFQAILNNGDIEDISPAQRVAGGLLMFLGLVIVGTVQIWMLSTRGQTIGKRLMSVRIVLLANNANPGFVGAVLMRAVVPAIISAVPFVGAIFSLVDVCFIFRDDRRCIHDLIAGTKVVKV
jgi:uncharacterized RDD family membrane protein YckC